MEQVLTVNSHVNLTRSLRTCTFVVSVNFILIPSSLVTIFDPYEEGTETDQPGGKPTVPKHSSVRLRNENQL